MGLINTNHQQMTQSMIDLQSGLLKNPYYIYGDKKALPVTYFNLNKDRSTLDNALKIPYANLGEESPLRYNMIQGLYLYGIDNMGFNLDNGEYGLESSEISGDAYILPDTIQPYPGDYFIIDMLKQKYLFKVITVNPDTFENGANYWKLDYKLDRLNADMKNIMQLVVSEFIFNATNTGSKYHAVVEKVKWNMATKIDQACTTLKLFYRSLFFNEYVQTYTFVHLYHVCRTNLASDYFYDPYLVEFMIKNKVMQNTGENYNYLSHKTTLKPEFIFKYTKSFWKTLEEKEMDNLDACIIQGYGVFINDPGTIFASRYENYFEMNYGNVPAFDSLAETIFILDPQVIGHIKEAQIFEPSNKKYAIYNILIKYFNDIEYDIDDILNIEAIAEQNMDYKFYYLIPMIIYCLDMRVKKMLS